MRSQQSLVPLTLLLATVSLTVAVALRPWAYGTVASAQSATGTATEAATATSDRPIIMTPRLALLPLVLRGFDHRSDFTPPPPGKTATATATWPPTATAEPTETTAPSSTPVPTATEVATEAATPTWTPEPVELKGNVVIVDVIPVTLGARFEAVVLQNQGNAAEEVSGWHLIGTGRVQRMCVLPDGLILEPQAYYEVRSGKDAAAGQRDNARFGPVAGHVCTTDLIWDNNEDMAVLFDRNQQPRSKWCWNVSGPFTCP